MDEGSMLNRACYGSNPQLLLMMQHFNSSKPARNSLDPASIQLKNACGS
jgi:hypothetical protein